MATSDPTVNYSWNLPANGGDSSAWGTMLNTIIGDTVTGIDAILKSVSDLASGALPKSGGTMTGNLKTLTQNLTLVDLGSLGGTENIDMATGNVFKGSHSASAITFTFSNVPTGAFAIIIEVAVGGSTNTVTWPAAVKWVGGSAPTFTISQTHSVFLYTIDGGTKWRGTMFSTTT
jgi:hypothetical protein